MLTLRSPCLFPAKKLLSHALTVEIDPLTFGFAKRNLANAGYHDIVLIKGDGGLGYPEMSPYDRVCITAACSEVPLPLIEQLKTGGSLLLPKSRRGFKTSFY